MSEQTSEFSHEEPSWSNPSPEYAQARQVRNDFLENRLTQEKDPELYQQQRREYCQVQERYYQHFLEKNGPVAVDGLTDYLTARANICEFVNQEASVVLLEEQGLNKYDLGSRFLIDVLTSDLTLADQRAQVAAQHYLFAMEPKSGREFADQEAAYQVLVEEMGGTEAATNVLATMFTRQGMVALVGGADKRSRTNDGDPIRTIIGDWLDEQGRDLSTEEWRKRYWKSHDMIKAFKVRYVGEAFHKLHERAFPISSADRQSMSDFDLNSSWSQGFNNFRDQLSSLGVDLQTLYARSKADYWSYADKEFGQNFCRVLPTQQELAAVHAIWE